MSQDLSRRQVELILRRTAELERSQAAADDGAGDADGDAISTDDLVKVAGELGLSQPALARALAEAQAGLLAPEPATGLVARVFGPNEVAAARYVPGDVAGVRATIARFLEEQGFQLKRNHGDRTVWERSPGLWTSVRTAFTAGPYRLPRDVELEVQVATVPGGSHPVFVRLRGDTSRARGRNVTGATTSVIAGAAVATVGAALLPIPTELATWGIGALGAAAGVLGTRASYRGSRASLALALERFLDFLEHEPAKAVRPTAEPFARLLDFMRDGWR